MSEENIGPTGVRTTFYFIPPPPFQRSLAAKAGRGHGDPLGADERPVIPFVMRGNGLTRFSLSLYFGGRATAVVASEVCSADNRVALGNKFGFVFFFCVLRIEKFVSGKVTLTRSWRAPIRGTTDQLRRPRGGGTVRIA